MSFKDYQDKHREIENTEPKKATRHDTGKLRFDLIPAYATEQVARVFTNGAVKYGDRNWEKGMNWSRVIASLKRHLNSFEQGEDIDLESGLLHTAHIATNALFLVEYSKIYKEGDDRSYKIKN